MFEKSFPSSSNTICEQAASGSASLVADFLIMPRTCAVCRSLTSDQPGLRPPGSDALKEDFINGATGVVTAVHIAPDGITPTVIYFRPDGAAADVRVVPKRTACKVYGLGEVDRHQFPLVPAHCVTVQVQ